MQLGLLPCVDVSFVSQGIDWDGEGLLVGRLVALSPDEYVGLGLT